MLLRKDFINLYFVETMTTDLSFYVIAMTQIEHFTVIKTPTITSNEKNSTNCTFTPF
jgi:hypothetical protein